jgi:hypothetical protein
MPKKSLTNDHKKVIAVESTTKTAAEIAKDMYGIGEKTVQKYIDEINAVVTPPPQKNPAITTITGDAPRGSVVMDQATSTIVDAINRPSKLDLRGKASAINKNKPVPNGVILSDE